MGIRLLYELSRTCRASHCGRVRARSEWTGDWVRRFARKGPSACSRLPLKARSQPERLPSYGLKLALVPRRLMEMIQDVDESLRALVKREALNGSKAEIAFDAPTREWSSRRNVPTVDLYLYDIREDLERREVMWEEIRGA